MDNYKYSRDWFVGSEIRSMLLQFLANSNETRILEVGCFEGLSSVYFADNLLDNSNSSLTCVDPFLNIHDNFNKEYSVNTEMNFDYNISICKNSDKITIHKITSDTFFENNSQTYNLIYINGYHKPDVIIRDMENSFNVLEKNGILWMNDYDRLNDIQIKNAMDTFLQKYNGQYELIHQGYQLAVKKICDTFARLENIQEFKEVERDPLDFLKYGFYINLNERVDRKENLLNNFKSLDIPTLQMTRIDAVKHQYGAIGCYLSHIICLERAKENGYDHILICEDDIQFTNVPILKTQLRKIIKNIINWDVIMLASNILEIEKHIDFKYFARVTNGYCGTGYIVKSHYYDKLLQNFHEGVQELIKNPTMGNHYALDVYWNPLQRTDMWIIPLPLTVSQLPSYSNIENRYVNYNDVMLKKTMLGRVI